MTGDAPGPADQPPVTATAEPASVPDATPANERRQDVRSPSTSAPTGAANHDLFRKRADAIGPAPVYFSIALGIMFGASLGLLLDQLIIGIIFGAMLGALYGLIRRANHRG